MSTNSESESARRPIEKSFAKCDYCRKKKIKCLPVSRDWSIAEKCNACERGGQPCGPNVRFPARTDSSLPPSASSPPAVTSRRPVRSAHTSSANPALLAEDADFHGVRTGAIPYVVGQLPARPVQQPWSELTRYTGRGVTAELVEEGPVWMPSADSVVSPTRPGTNNLGAVNDHSTSLAVPAISNASLKRTHDQFAEPDTVWSETRFRQGHGIRLLRLHGGTGNDPLQGRLILSDGKETYEALSYSAGPMDGNATITILSAASTYKLAIKPNLEAALRHLRFPDRYRLLWIDVICINLNDYPERNHHVQRMGSIFNTASNVCIWLGPAHDKSELAFALIRKAEYAHNQRVDVAQEADKGRLDALLSLLERRWFTRRWAVQEVALAKQATIYCGNESMQWAEFADAISILQSDWSPFLPRDVPAVGSQALARARVLASTAGCHLVDVSGNIFRKSDGGTILDSLCSLESLVCNMAAFEISRFHDTIYAYLSLAEDTGARYSIRAAAAFPMSMEEVASEPIELSLMERKRALSVIDAFRARRKSADTEYLVDYGKSDVEACKDFVSFVVSNTRSVDIICRPWAPAAQRDELPSWVATLADSGFKNGRYARTQADALVGPAGMRQKPYNASRKYPMSYNISKEANSTSLFADGCILDSIKELTEAAEDGIPVSWRELVGWSPSETPPPERFWRTLIANRGHDASNPPHYFQKACHSFFTNGPVENNVYASAIHTEHPEFVAEFLQRVQAITWRRRMIMTEEERLLGLAPQTARAGDLVCIIFGCSVPVVLRKVVSDAMTGEHHYELMGDCYIHGMMDGEAFTIQQTRNIPQTQFELR